MVALDDVDAHGDGVIVDPEPDVRELLELVDMIGVWLRGAEIGLIAVAGLQPQHLRLAADAHVHAAMVGAELILHAFQVAAGVAVEELFRMFGILAAPEHGAEDPPHALVPGQLAESFRVRHGQEFGRVGRKPDQVAVPVGEDVGDAAEPGLQPLLRGVLPVPGRDRLAHDATGDRDVLVVDVVDTQLVDLFAHRRDGGGTALLV